MGKPRIALLHYSAPPVVGGVEIVLKEQARLFSQAGYPVAIIAGRGSREAVPGAVDYIEIPEMDTQNPEVLRISADLGEGTIPSTFQPFTRSLQKKIEPILAGFDRIIVHNVFSKHFNIPLTAALFKIAGQDKTGRWYSWCHDLSWTSPHSQSQVHPGYPWDLLRTYFPEIVFVAISLERQKEMAGLYGCDPDLIHVIYNGVNPADVLGLSPEGLELVRRIGLFEAELIILMPVRITQAKNVELALKLSAELKKRGCSIRLVVTGPPDPHDAANNAYIHSLKQMRLQLGIEAEAVFMFEFGLQQDEGYYLDEMRVGELYRLCDLVIIPSHREGFGIPVLEAGLSGVPVFSADIPAAREIGRNDLFYISHDADPSELARQIITWKDINPVHQLKQRVRRGYTWEAVFHHAIEPLILSD